STSPGGAWPESMLPPRASHPSSRSGISPDFFMANIFTDRVDISVVVATYNRCSVLRRALESVVAQHDRSVPYEVIVVDNNSSDETRQVVESFSSQDAPRVKYIFEAKQGVSYARNAGIAGSSAPVIAFFDDDVCVAPDWIVNIKRTLDEHPE